MDVLTPKGLAQARSDFALHVMLVMKQNNEKKAAAQAIAYYEGEKGFHVRLGTPKLPLEEPKK